MFGIGPMEAVIVAVLGLGLPLGIPPLPPDEALLRAAPDECLVFISSAGVGKPDTASENHTDQLLADAQVQTFLAGFADQITGAMKQLGDKDAKLKPFFEDGKPLVEVVLSRPMAIYLERLEMAPGAPPTPVAGFIVNCGDRKLDVKNALDSIEGKAIHKNEGSDDDIKDVKIAGISLRQAKVGHDVEIDWGFKDKYFFIAVGPDAAANLIKRISGSGPKPKWMAALEKQAAIKRTSTIAYLDAAGLLELALPQIPDEKAKAGIAASGLADLISYTTVTGLGTKGIVNRSFANFKAAPSGLFALLDGKPLTAGDLKPIPAKAVAAGALRLDPLRVYKAVLEIVEKVDPEEVKKFKERAEGGAQALGFRLEEDVLGSFGDAWTFHSTSAIGPSPAGGLVVTVNLKNRDTMVKIVKLAVSMAKMQQGQMPFSISETKIGDVEAYNIVAQTGSPISPAWAIADNRLVVAGSLDGLKMQLRSSPDSQGLAEVAAVSSRLKAGAVLLTYQDTKTILTQLLALLQVFGPRGTDFLKEQGIDVTLPAVPDIEKIAPHVLPRTSTLRISKQSIVSEAYDTVPLVGSLISSAPVAGLFATVGGRAVMSARGAARTNQAMNNMKQILLALHNDHSVHNRFPAAAIYSKDGKPLLSWRVAILPYLGEASLYQQFHLDEPWDSENNKPLADKMPTVYTDPKVGDLAGKTVYVVPTGPEMIFASDKGTSMKEITDGTSKTIMLVEVDREHAVPWTKPDDLKIEKATPSAGLAPIANGMYLTGFADGSVQTMPASVDATTLWALFTRAGGEAVQIPRE